MLLEGFLLTAAGIFYLGAALLSVMVALRKGQSYANVMALLGVALVLHTVSITHRWIRLEHGPYVDLFEILSSNVWSLHLIVLLVALAVPAVRSGLSATLPILAILTLWLLATPAKDTTAPVTYDTFWLPVHMVLGKIFLGLTVVALGLAVLILARRVGLPLGHAPDDDALDSNAYRFMLAAVVFQSLMLIAGAGWARDAWGRYWAWDPLESWSFLTWLAMLAYLHLRPIRREGLSVNALMIVGVYVLAFATFFGVPFLSIAPHKGAI